MIDPKQLRVGNKVNFQFNPEQRAQEVTVAWVSDDSIGYKEQHEASYPQSPKSFYGIPLTPEWLERSGFRKDMGGGGGLLEFENGFICFYDMNNPLVGYSGVSDELINGGPIHNLNYVHQLQNLYFALTGEELTIKS